LSTRASLKMEIAVGKTFDSFSDLEGALEGLRKDGCHGFVFSMCVTFVTVYSSRGLYHRESKGGSKEGLDEASKYIYLTVVLHCL